MAGPFDPHCQIETFRGCASAVDCPAAGDTCITTSRECYPDSNGAVGGSVSATGAASAPVADTSTPTLASLFCVGPVGAAVNSAAGLPGLGRLTLTGTARGLP
jgi:hypothetical protein